MNIYLVRHTEPVSADDQWRFLGRSDPALSPRGIEQANELAARLHDMYFDSVYSSDLIRAMQTAEIISAAASGRPGAAQRATMRDRTGAERDVVVRPDPRLREIDTGLWEGLTREEAAERYPDEHAERERDLYHRPFPGGESFADVRARALPGFYDAARMGGETILIVSHKGVIRVLLCEFLGLPPDRLFSLSQDYGCVNLVQAARRPDGSLEIEGAQPDISLS